MTGGGRCWHRPEKEVSFRWYPGQSRVPRQRRNTLHWNSGRQISILCLHRQKHGRNGVSSGRRIPRSADRLWYGKCTAATGNMNAGQLPEYSIDNRGKKCYTILQNEAEMQRILQINNKNSTCKILLLKCVSMRRRRFYRFGRSQIVCNL